MAETMISMSAPPFLLLHLKLLQRNGRWTADIVRRTTMMRHITTNQLFNWVKPKHIQISQHDEKWKHKDRHPPQNEKHATDLTGQQCAVAIKYTTHRIIIRTINRRDQIRVGKETYGDTAPDTIGQMHRYGVDCIINFQRNQSLGCAKVHQTCHETDGDGGPGLHGRAACCNRHQAGQTSVHGHGQIEHFFTRQKKDYHKVEQQGADAAGSSGQSRSDGSQCGNIAIPQGGDGKGGAGVEAIPAKP
mmetsp:Transcript_2142/g.3147  ORF Transcript_2142/g.3147 Transcript_2142/m.3147 type:complete len:246 (+) Transcript_2142:329-1066(+)